MDGSNDDVQNNVELYAAAQEAIALQETNRPKNTSLVYEPKQQEFIVRQPAPSSPSARQIC